jgi:DNA-binding MarR family transcriptional regulator
VSRAKPSRDPDLLAIYEFTTLVSASARSARQHERIVRAVDASITGAGLVALRVVERHGPIAMSEVARRLQVDQSTVSRHVRPLEERGLLTRTAAAADRRVAWLRVTVTGQRLLDGARDVVLHDFDVALGDWSTDDRRQLADLLDRLRRDLLTVEVDASGWSVASRKGKIASR